MARLITMIVVHCSATRCNQPYPVQQLFHDHVEVNHWRYIGYHFYITRSGRVETTRPLERMGAHAKGHNAHSIGICYEGGLDANGKPSDTRTPQQKVALRKLLAELRKKYPSSVILGHHDLDTKKACPCFSISEYADLQP